VQLTYGGTLRRAGGRSFWRCGDSIAAVVLLRERRALRHMARGGTALAGARMLRHALDLGDTRLLTRTQRCALRGRRHSAWRTACGTSRACVKAARQPYHLAFCAHQLIATSAAQPPIG